MNPKLKEAGAELARNFDDKFANLLNEFKNSIDDFVNKIEKTLNNPKVLNLGLFATISIATYGAIDHAITFNNVNSNNAITHEKHPLTNIATYGAIDHAIIKYLQQNGIEITGISQDEKTIYIKDIDKNTIYPTKINSELFVGFIKAVEEQKNIHLSQNTKFDLKQ